MQLKERLVLMLLLLLTLLWVPSSLLATLVATSAEREKDQIQ